MRKLSPAATGGPHGTTYQQASQDRKVMVENVCREATMRLLPAVIAALWLLVVPGCGAPAPREAPSRFPCSDGELGDPCQVDVPEDQCAAGLHCFNPFRDEGSGCVGVCRAEGEECTAASDCDGGSDSVGCEQGYCEPICC